MAKRDGLVSERRKFLNAAACLMGAAALGGYIAYDTLRAPSYEEAYKDENLRARWAEGFDAGPHAKIMIATPFVLDELKNKRNYAPPKGAFAATFPIDDSRIGSGTRSNVYVLPECFDPVYKEHIAPMSIVIENVIENHELVHAGHFAKGIPGIPPALFLRGNSTLDKRLFTAASEVLAYKSEFLGIQREKDRFVSGYRSGLKQLVKNALLDVLTLTNDRSIIDRLQGAANF